MGRAKIKRGSTNIDMTAMCDVAFLLLSFFILTAQFKPSEAVNVTTPSSVASKAAPEKNTFMVSLDKEGKVFIGLSDDMKMDVIHELASARGFKMSDEDLKYFQQASFVGASIAQLNQFIRIPSEQIKNVVLTGIPVDSTNNELTAWVNAAINVYKDKTVKLNFLIKGDNDAKYPAFKSVLDAFKKNDIYKYLLVTTPEDIPPGSEMQKLNDLKPNGT